MAYKHKGLGKRSRQEVQLRRVLKRWGEVKLQGMGWVKTRLPQSLVRTRIRSATYKEEPDQIASASPRLQPWGGGQGCNLPMCVVGRLFGMNRIARTGDPVGSSYPKTLSSRPGPARNVGGSVSHERSKGAAPFARLRFAVGGLIVLACGFLFLAPASSATTVSSPHLPNPTTNLAPCTNLPFPQVTFFHAIVCAHQDEGVKPLGVDATPLQQSTFDKLPKSEQVFAITNLERVDRGLAPIFAMTTQLDTAARAGVNENSDPELPAATARTVLQAGPNKASTVPTVLRADYEWMYVDGSSGYWPYDNVGAKKSGLDWVHRDNILFLQPTCPSGKLPIALMGAAASPAYGGVVTSIHVTYCKTPGQTIFATWPRVEKILGLLATVPATSASRVAGGTAAATAAAGLEHAFPPKTPTCPGTTQTRPVVLATETDFPDALASAYLARSLGTGLLLTKGTVLPAATEAALAAEGITKVYVVGGPRAVSTTVVEAIEALPVHRCGGSATSSSATITASTRIWGQTQYTTALNIAKTPSSTLIGTLDLSNAYSGQYNATKGNGSSAPASSGALRTAIVATGASYPDAMSASALAYAERLPILLTAPNALGPQVATAIRSLRIQQVVVMGGPFAVSDTVVAGLEGTGVSVIRIAGSKASGTSTELAKFETASTDAGASWSGDGKVVVARSTGFTDGLAGAVVAAGGPATNAHEPLVLTQSKTTAGTTLITFLQGAVRAGLGGAPLSHFTVLGGVDAISKIAVNEMGAVLTPLET